MKALLNASEGPKLIELSQINEFRLLFLSHNLKKSLIPDLSLAPICRREPNYYIWIAKVEKVIVCLEIRFKVLDKLWLQFELRVNSSRCS